MLKTIPVYLQILLLPLLFLPLPGSADQPPHLTTTITAPATKPLEHMSVDGNTLQAPLSTTTVEQKDLCPVVFLLEADYPQQKLLKDFSEMLRGAHEKASRYVTLYYLHSPELTLIIASNDDIKRDARTLLKSILPVIRVYLQEGQAELPQQVLDDTDALLNRIAYKSSLPLRELIRMAKSDIVKKTIFQELSITIVP